MSCCDANLRPRNPRLLSSCEPLHFTLEIVVGKDAPPSSHLEGIPRLLQLKIEAMNPDRRTDLEKENPRKYGGLDLVSIYVGSCQSLLFSVNLYFKKPITRALVQPITPPSPTSPGYAAGQRPCP